MLVLVSDEVLEGLDFLVRAQQALRFARRALAAGDLQAGGFDVRREVFFAGVVAGLRLESGG